jgi:hypothetical protein
VVPGCRCPQPVLLELANLRVFEPLLVPRLAPQAVPVVGEEQLLPGLRAGHRQTVLASRLRRGRESPRAGGSAPGRTEGAPVEYRNRAVQRRAIVDAVGAGRQEFVVGRGTVRHTLLPEASGG